MKKLLIILLLTALAGCVKEPSPTGYNLPTYACTVMPTGETRMRKVAQYCGKGCVVPQYDTVPEHEVKLTCEYREWRVQ